MSSTATRPDWRADLPRLAPLNLPLLPCGAGREQKGPIDPSTGYGLSKWETARFSVDQITAMNGVVRSVGTRTGAGLLCFDLDGATSIELALAHGCDPQQAQTWQVHRDTDPHRLKVLWRLTPEQQAAIGEVTKKAHTQHPPRGRDGKPTGKGEAVEVFHHPGRQVLLIGHHVPSSGHYVWPDGMGPEALAPIPPAWWTLALAIARGELGLQPKRPANTIKATSKGSDGRQWRALTDCPICGRDKGYCAESRTDGAIRCFHGSTFSPEISHGVLKVGQTITGRNGTVYGFCGAEQQSNGDVFSTFRVHQDRPPAERSRKAPEAAPVGGGERPKGKPKPNRGKPKKLSLIRRLACFDHCVAALVDRERNTLRRTVRLRAAVEALGLKGAIRDGEMAEAVMQAIDRRNGNVYALLSGEEMNHVHVPVIRWLIPGVIPANDLTILGGRPKVGKNRIAVDAVRAMLRQEDFLGFGAAPSQPDIILVTDDQGDASTKEQLQKHGIFGHPRLHWSRKFRVTISDVDRLVADVEARPGALVVIDSLRSITRSCRFKENDPEMGALVYDLKNSIIDKGGSLLLIHHCNKATEATGVEALSGHSAIAGAGSTVLTLHYLNAGKIGSLPMKATPDRRLACESRDSQGFDLVVTLDGGSGRWQRVGTHAEWLAHQGDEKRAKKVADLSEAQKVVLEVIGGWPDEKGPTVREIAQSISGEQEPPKSRINATREKCQAMTRRGLLRELNRGGISTYQISEIPQES